MFLDMLLEGAVSSSPPTEARLGQQPAAGKRQESEREIESVQLKRCDFGAPDVYTLAQVSPYLVTLRCALLSATG